MKGEGLTRWKMLLEPLISETGGACLRRPELEQRSEANDESHFFPLDLGSICAETGSKNSPVRLLFVALIHTR